MITEIPTTDLGALRVTVTGLSAARLAALVGMGAWRLRRLEYGRAAASDEEIRALAKALGIRPVSVPVKRKKVK